MPSSRNSLLHSISTSASLKSNSRLVSRRLTTNAETNIELTSRKWLCLISQWLSRHLNHHHQVNISNLVLHPLLKKPVARPLAPLSLMNLTPLPLKVAVKPSQFLHKLLMKLQNTTCLTAQILVLQLLTKNSTRRPLMWSPQLMSLSTPLVLADLTSPATQTTKTHPIIRICNSQSLRLLAAPRRLHLYEMSGLSRPSY